jgi:hypothetical protein
MTEQQILDKTIEYLNKYSNNFKKWQNNGKELFARHADVGVFSSIAGALLKIDFLNTENSKLIISFMSEFRIDYNIIKDLAQHGTNALG